MSDAKNIVVDTLLGRSLLFGLILSVSVYLIGIRLDLWQVGRGNYVVFIILGGCLVLLPAYERIARLKQR